MKTNRFLLLAVIGTMAFAANAMALDSKTTTEPCEPYTKASATDLDSFNANNSSILGSNPLGGVQLTSLVKSLILADAGTVLKILELLKTATPQQVSAIGSGLGQAVAALKKSCDDVDKKTAESVAILVGSVGNDALLLAYNNAVKGTATFAVDDTGVPSARGSVGGLANGNNGNGGPGTTNSPSPGSFFVSNTSQQFSFSSPGISFAGVTTTCITSVSPTHTC